MIAGVQEARVPCSLMHRRIEAVFAAGRGSGGVTAAGRRRAGRPSPEIVGLFLIFAATAGLALWQASNHLSPTIFTDELEMTQLCALDRRHGPRHAPRRSRTGIAPLAAYLSAPFWWIDDVPTAYGADQVLGRVVMATAVFPAYGLARLAVAPALGALRGGGRGHLAGARVRADPRQGADRLPGRHARPVPRGALGGDTRRPAALLLAVGGLRARLLAKDQLAVLFPVLGLTALAVIWRGERMTAFRRTWTRATGSERVILALGAVIVAGAFVVAAIDVVVRRRRRSSRIACSTTASGPPARSRSDSGSCR